MPYRSRRNCAWAALSEAAGDKIDKVGRVVRVDAEPLPVFPLTGVEVFEGALCSADVGKPARVVEIVVPER